MSEGLKGNKPRFCKSGVSVQTSLKAIAKKAKEQPEYQFRNLYGMIDIELLKLAWRELNKKAVAGVDRVTAQDYAKNLDANLIDLVDRLIRDAYRARLVKQKLIQKSPGKTRSLGILVLEDRLLQTAVAMILNAIYEPTFLDSSFGYRKGKDAKTAVKALRDELNFGEYHYVIEADIKGFFDNISHDRTLRLLGVRINDKKLLRLIKKWLNAGILGEDGKVINPLTGTPQGGIVSPVLANVYLHYVLDRWVEGQVRRVPNARLTYVRYADDFVLAVGGGYDPHVLLQSISDRLLLKGDLELAEDKTKVIRFSRYAGKENGRFDFLGFEISWGKARSGMPNVKRRTGRRRIRRAIKETTEWIKANRSTKLNSMLEQLNQKFRGHYQYYGVIGNHDALKIYYYNVLKSLFKWLNRRSQKKSFTWKQFLERVRPKLTSPTITEKQVLQLPLPGIRC